MSLKNNSLWLVLLLCLSSGLCAQPRQSLSQFPDHKILVVAHRGDWRNAPENSLWAIKKAIEMGVDMAEIDLARTKDGVLVLMHDKTLERTTTGSGKVSEITFAELQQLYLKDGLGIPTQMRVPRLESVLELSKDRIFLNLDKGFDYIDQVFPILESLGMLEQVLFKGSVSYQEFKEKYGAIKDQIHYMPIVHLGKTHDKKQMEVFLDNYKPYGFEFIVAKEQDVIDFDDLKKRKVKVWMNSLWPVFNANHQDDKALEDLGVYDWYVGLGVNVIQTDRPEELIEFLKKRKLKF